MWSRGRDAYESYDSSSFIPFIKSSLHSCVNFSDVSIVIIARLRKKKKIIRKTPTQFLTNKHNDAAPNVFPPVYSMPYP